MLKGNFTEEINGADYETERNKPLPSLNHSLIQTNLVLALGAYRTKYRIASELSLELSDWPSVPDICLLPLIKIDTKNDRIKFSEPPLCVIEILSPIQSITELLSKAKAYFQHGVQSCWLVLPGLDNIYVFSSLEEYEIFKTGEMLEDKKMDIQLDVSSVFE